MRISTICLMFLAFCVSAPVARSAEYPYRWVYVSRGLHKDEDVEDIGQIVRTASQHGLNGMVLAVGLDGLDRQPEAYFKRLEEVKRICAENHVEIIPIVFSAGYGGRVLGHNRNLAAGLPVNDARFLVEGKDAQLKTDYPVSIPNGGFEQHKGDRVLGCRFHDAPGKVSFVDTITVWRSTRGR